MKIHRTEVDGAVVFTAKKLFRVVGQCTVKADPEEGVVQIGDFYANGAGVELLIEAEKEASKTGLLMVIHTMSPKLAQVMRDRWGWRVVRQEFLLTKESHGKDSTRQVD